MSDSTNFLRELLELDERQDATNVEPQVTSSPVSDPPPPQPATTPPSEFAAIVSPPPVMLEPTIVDLPPETDSESEAHSVVSIPRRATKGKWRKTYLGRPPRRRPAVPKDGKLKGTSGGPKASPKPPPRSKDIEPVVRTVAHVTTVPPRTTTTASSKSLRPTLPPVEPKANPVPATHSTPTGSTRITPTNDPPVSVHDPTIMKHTPEHYKWSDDIPEFLTPSLDYFDIPMDFLTRKFPNGLNLSPNCSTWLVHLGIYDWDDLTVISTRYTVESLMRKLTVDYYFKYRNDMRIFLAFGDLCSPSSARIVSPDVETPSWIPSLVRMARNNYPIYLQQEQLASTKIFTTSVVASPAAVKRGGLGIQPTEPTSSLPFSMTKTPFSPMRDTVKKEPINKSHVVLETTDHANRPLHSTPETHCNPDFDDTLDEVEDILDQHGYIDTNVKWEKEDTLPRGVGYPAKSGSLLLKDTQKRLETPHMSYSEVTRYLKSHLPAKIQWDGTTGGFREYKIAVEGFYTQMQADYLFDKKFQQIYVKCGPARTIDHPLLPKYIKISRPQLEEAKVHLYGAIKHSTKRSNTVLKYIYKHSDSRDGILVWIDLCNFKDNDGNVQVREARP